jgi:hypothetical protein
VCVCSNSGPANRAIVVSSILFHTFICYTLAVKVCSPLQDHGQCVLRSRAHLRVTLMDMELQAGQPELHRTMVGHVFTHICYK